MIMPRYILLLIVVCLCFGLLPFGQAQAQLADTARLVNECYKGTIPSCRSLCRIKYNGGQFCAEQYQSTFNPNISSDDTAALRTACTQNTNERNVKYCQILCNKGEDAFCNYCRFGYMQYCKTSALTREICKPSGPGVKYARAAIIPWETLQTLCLDTSNEFGLASCYQLCKQGCKTYCDPCRLGWNSQCKGKVAKKRGVGLPNVPVGYSAVYTDTPLSQWKGEPPANRDITLKTLRNAWRANEWGTKDDYDGEPTFWEEEWLMINGNPALYKKYSGNPPLPIKPPKPPEAPVKAKKKR